MQVLAEHRPATRASVSTRTARRDLAIDAMRGAAMFFVCLSHFGTEVAKPWSGVSEQVGDALVFLGKVASPAFMLVGGVTVATLAADPARFEKVRSKLIDRGLFTLLLGHLIVGLSDGMLLENGRLRHRLGITDVAGFALVLAATRAATWPARKCLGWAAFLLSCAWLSFFWLRPASAPGQWIAGPLVGSPSEHLLNRGFPLVPWLGVYFIGLALGKLRSGWSPWTLASRRLGAIALTAIGLGAAGWLLRDWMLQAAGWPAAGTPLYRFLSPIGKFPPGAVYLLFFGGIAVLLFAFVERLAGQGRSRMPLWLAPVGRASLFTFIAQALLYQRLLPALRPDLRGTWPLWFGASLLVLYPAAWWWQSRDLNRLFTLGLANRFDRDRETPERESIAA